MSDFKVGLTKAASGSLPAGHQWDTQHIKEHTHLGEEFLKISI